MLRRAEPPLRVARLRAEGRILEIGPGDLSLTCDEASSLLRNAEVALGEDEMAELHRRTEGWPAGLYLAALYLREGGSLASAAWLLPSSWWKFPVRQAWRTRDQPGNGWTVVLRRQPARMVEGLPEGGYTDMFEIICCGCDDHPDLDYSEVSPELQRVRGPYPIAADIATYQKHLRLHQETRRRTGGGR